MINTLKGLVEEAKKGEKLTLAVAVAEDHAVLEAVFMAEDEGLVTPLLFGNKEEIGRLCAEYGYSDRDPEIIDAEDKPDACAKAAVAVRDGNADLIMKGLVDTGVVMKAVLNRDNGLRTGNIISHSLLLEVAGYDRLFCVTDCAMNIAPDAEAKAGIIQNAVSVMHAIGNSNPKVAALCAIEKVNPKMQCTLEAEQLTKWNEEGRITGCVVQGPLALDNAVSEEAAIHKGISGPVAGKADILLAPDIEAGNMLVKGMEYFANAGKAGVILGARTPVVLTSRATSAQSKMYSIALGVLIAKHMAE